MGSHGKMLIDVIYTSFIGFMQTTRSVRHWDPHTPWPKVPVSENCSGGMRPR